MLTHSAKSRNLFRGISAKSRILPLRISADSHILRKGRLIENYFREDEKEKIDSYWNQIGDSQGLAVMSSMQRTYKAAERYSRQHGFRIYNATRGGKVEAFERVDFDSLF